LCGLQGCLTWWVRFLLFLGHTLTISGVYVDLIEQARGSAFTVHTFTTEPYCWHPTGNGATLRPDAYAVLRARNVGHCWWLEIDNGTETGPRLRAKLRTYRDHATGGGVGPDGAPPRLLFTTPNQHRAHQITGLLTEGDDTTTATTHNQAAAYMIKELTTPRGLR
jgi:Replication-relaxation